MTKLVGVLAALFASAVSVVRAQDIISTLAGGGPNNVPALTANISTPTSIAIDSQGNLYIAAAEGKVIFKVDPGGTLTVVAGNGGSGFLGDGGPATNESLVSISAFAGFRLGPSGVAVDQSGNIFIADPTYYRVARVDAHTGIITTAAGIPGDDLMRFPSAIVLDASGNLFISDKSDNRVRRVRVDAPTQIATVAGTGTAIFSGDGGPAIDAGIAAPHWVWR